ncbi:hypothetical protein BOTBODRAFT_172284 [Botryobasidium botryosum FD-172 SS1]|uniref:Uncharacterized protein n=1 Tax=Botryobasidium botryosum (strain FD-172 SS1) TaxID=930990 RepID=A0A067MNT4_BOTB1|nr:hypothetical protein BOTBODRAFT_172284 [Botryobasidium botryosum FD-172 SS1]
MGSLQFDEVILLGIWTEILLYGLYVPLFFVSIWVMMYRSSTTDVNWAMLALAVVLFVLSTMHIGVGLRRLLEGFVYASDAHGYFRDQDKWLNRFFDCLYVTMNMIYRCYVAWDSSIAVVALPILLLFGAAGTGYYALSSPHKLVLVQASFSSPIAIVGQVHFILILILNVAATTLIAWGITRGMRMAPRTTEARMQSIYSRVLAVGVESAALYTLSLLVLVGLHMGSSDAQYIVYCANTQIISIVCTLILVCISLGTNGWDPTRGAVLPAASTVGVEVHIRRESVYQSSDGKYEL